MASRIDVSIERGDATSGGAPPAQGAAGGPAKRDPNTCPKCHSHYRSDELDRVLRVCPHCGHHFSVSARERVAQLADGGTFTEADADLRSDDPLGFFDLRPYKERLAEAEISSGIGDVIVTGAAKIERRDCELAVMDFGFMGGSMGSAVGEKLARACERAAARGVPLVCVTASGGARMQEGILSLMQMPKTVCSVDALQEARCAFIVVMAHPTTGGVVASFASLGDFVIAEPGALLSFAGPRVVQETTREKLPEDFGMSEANFRHGHLDAVVSRDQLKPFLGRLLALFTHDG
jgi:acetyl-CoA carboxylase carboxyl transferase subunit beta